MNTLAILVKRDAVLLFKTYLSEPSRKRAGELCVFSNSFYVPQAKCAV
ncbi:MAG: hypothetical protein KKB82_06640 [Candidatus Omnitrophica bacterium]|nr:hypothetical protein [Candidatus Omnitrophota bacterium]MBU1925580.1 hypothetical protein [Candidatus Omnitrophota bacterium]MBU2064166.1 hypothetical protein [Candidatus Omnitrophota bacterium]